MTYPVDLMTLGHLKQQKVVAVHMPRKDFLAAVEATLAAGRWDRYQGIKGKMRATAKTMDRFPLGTWIDNARGCGCVVGEYLVAADIIQRANAAQVNVDEEIYAAFPERIADALINFGNDVDEQVQNALNDDGSMDVADRLGDEHYAIEGRPLDTVVIIED